MNDAMQWWIIGGGGVLGFVSFVASRYVMSCKPCSVEESAVTPITFELPDVKDPEAWRRYGGASLYHNETIFESGIPRHIHVNRPAIAKNMKNGETYPTCVVIDPDGVKHQFHQVVMCGAATLQFDRNHPSANVYLSTRAEIRGYIEPALRPKFEVSEAKEVEPRQIWRDVFRPALKHIPVVGCLTEEKDSR